MRYKNKNKIHSTGSVFTICQNCKKEFTIEPEDFGFYEKIKVPPPTFCPDCRFQRRASYRNDRNIFRNKSAKSGVSIFSLYSISSGVTVYDEDEWRSDNWDALSYGKAYDFSRTFFNQLHELALSVPRPARSVLNNINCDYCVNVGTSKNCYLFCNSSGSENCMYGNNVIFSKECLEGSHSNKCEKCYELFWNESCYGTNFSSLCKNCVNVKFSENCIGCTDCLACVNLRGQKYSIFNKQYSREGYFEQLKQYKLDTWSGVCEMRKLSQDFFKKFPVRYLQGINNLHVTGEYISYSKNIYKSYIIAGSENIRYSQYLLESPAEDSMDITIWGENTDLCYEHAICGLGISNSKFCVETWTQITNCEYCMFCRNISDCFGCVGLKNKKYCILNVQYTKEEYEQLVDKIKKHMNEMPYVDKNKNIYRYGEFLPVEHSPFGYNTSIVSEHFPLSREEVISLGYPWQESEKREYATNFSTKDIPDSIKDVDDLILDKIISCHECTKAYKIMPNELSFLRKEEIPIPRSCVDCRYKTRINQRNPFKLWHRTCMCDKATHFHGEKKCEVEFETSYAPDRPEIVYCEKCYQQEVY